jgi:hypothetical protein
MAFGPIGYPSGGVADDALPTGSTRDKVTSPGAAARRPVERHLRLTGRHRPPYATTSLAPDTPLAHDNDVARIALALTAFVFAVGCAAQPASTKDTQTWAKSYAETTCADWINSMDVHQKFVMAGDLLLALQRQSNADASIPSDTSIFNFVGDIGTVCASSTGSTAASEQVSDVAQLVYTQGESQYKP